MPKSVQTWKVLKKLFAQSWVPLLLALIYAWWDFQSQPEPTHSASSFVRSVGVAFFLIMWFVGQWFRAQKQIGDTEQLSEIHAGIEQIKTHLVKEGSGPNRNDASPYIKHETSYYRLYSNGLLVQDLKLRVAPGIDSLPLTYPVAFPNELLSIQPIGNDAAWTTKASLGNCELKIKPSTHEREIQLRITGL